jgi:hypothetical protein
VRTGASSGSPASPSAVVHLHALGIDASDPYSALPQRARCMSGSRDNPRRKTLVSEEHDTAESDRDSGTRCPLSPGAQSTGYEQAGA